MFPYYIVRFKPPADITNIPFILLFPYYIVRFKQNISLRISFCAICFHTTQYDLNVVKMLSRQNDQKQFPYYIVRFKLQKSGKQRKRKKSFHTTQYDLNRSGFASCNCLTPSFHTTQYDLNGEISNNSNGNKIVSILHSTI